MQFASLFVDFDPRTLSKEHPFVPEGYLDYYYLFDEPEALHYHDFLEIGYCISGSGLFYVDGQVVPFSAPCCSIIYGGQIHIAQSIGTERSLWHFLYISVKKLFTDTDLIATNGLPAMTPHLFDFPSIIPHQDDPTLYELVTAILDESATLKEGYLTAMRGLLIALLTRHSRYMTPAHKVRENQEQILERLGNTLVYINQHYMEDISVNQMINACGLSKSTLLRDLTAFTGMAPMQYIHHLRLNRAAILLTGRESVSDIAFSVGYNSLSSFNRHFLHEYGMSPSKWRTLQKSKKL